MPITPGKGHGFDYPAGNNARHKLRLCQLETFAGHQYPFDKFFRMMGWVSKCMAERKSLQAQLKTARDEAIDEAAELAYQLVMDGHGACNVFDAIKRLKGE